MTYLGEMLLSIHEDNVPIAGAFSWGPSAFHLVLVFIRLRSDDSHGGQCRVGGRIEHKARPRTSRRRTSLTLHLGSEYDP